MSAPSAKYLAALSSLLTGDLWSNDGEEGLRPEQAALHLASVQAKALLLAVDWEESDNGRLGGWLHGHKWSKNDTITALSGLVSLLEGSRVVIEEMRSRGEYVDSMNRVGCEAHPAAELAELAAIQREAGKADACACEADEGETRP